jgi:hypothetical protein
MRIGNPGDRSERALGRAATNIIAVARRFSQPSREKRARIAIKRLHRRMKRG